MMLSGQDRELYGAFHAADCGAVTAWTARLAPIATCVDPAWFLGPGQSSAP
jgi:hypothetical protein